jgi:hypothetical protein
VSFNWNYSHRSTVEEEDNASTKLTKGTASVKVIKKTVMILAVLFLAAQAIRPSRVNPPVNASETIQAKLQIPPEVFSVLQRSCRDCHSSETRWPWYSNITPVSWLLVDHVEEGRKALSFSEWGTYSVTRAAHKLEEIVLMVDDDEMPLKSYLLMHSDARLSPSDKQLLVKWAEEERERLLGGEMGSTK